MSIVNPLEVWMRGPIEGIPALLQPVAHAILQAQEELHALLEDFPDTLLWKKPANVASVGFHLQHLSGVLDRLVVYAQDKALSEEQFDALKLETVSNQSNITTQSLINRFDIQVEQTLHFLSTISDKDLLASRGIGRKKLPTNVLGLLFHAAEHTQRHFGQLYVTVKVLENQ